MVVNETRIVRELVKEHQPVSDIELTFLCVARGIDPHDAIVLQDLLEKQGRIEYDESTGSFSTSDIINSV
jgi:hypothetical protein